MILLRGVHEVQECMTYSGQYREYEVGLAPFILFLFEVSFLSDPTKETMINQDYVEEW